MYGDIYHCLNAVLSQCRLSRVIQPTTGWGYPFFSVPPLTAPTRSTRVLVDFGLCAPTRLFFLTLVSRCWWTLTFALRRYDRQTLLVDFDLCAPTRLVFFILVSHCWWTLTCVLPLVMSFSHWSVAVGGL